MAIFRLGERGAAVAVGPLESKVLDVLWSDGPILSVPAVHSALTTNQGAISYSAVKAVLNNLADKGWLRKERQGKVTYFEVLKTRQEFDSQVMSTVIDSLHRNYGIPVIAKLVDQLAVDEDSIREFERLIAERKAELGQ